MSKDKTVRLHGGHGHACGSVRVHCPPDVATIPATGRGVHGTTRRSIEPALGLNAVVLSDRPTANNNEGPHRKAECGEFAYKWAWG